MPEYNVIYKEARYGSVLVDAPTADIARERALENGAPLPLDGDKFVEIVDVEEA